MFKALAKRKRELAQNVQSEKDAGTLQYSLESSVTCNVHLYQ
jgi:hypothetical protein